MQIEAVILVIGVLLLASVAQTVAGFGFALIAVPFLVMVLDVDDAVVVVALTAPVSSLLIARSVWHAVPQRSVTTLLAGAVAGMPIGLAVLKFAPEDVLRLGVGIASIAMAAAIVGGLRWGGSDRSGELLAGAVSGVLSTSTSMNGPPVVLYLQERGHPPDVFRGALSAYFSISGAISLALFAVAGEMNGRSLLLAAAGIPAVLVGGAIGRRLVGRLSDAAFRRMVMALLVVTASVAIVGAVVRLLG